MKRKRISNVHPDYYARKRRRGSVRNSLDSNRWNYSRELLRGAAGVAGFIAGGPEASQASAATADLAYTMAFTSTQNNMSGDGGATGGHVPFTPHHEIPSKHIRGKKNVKFSKAKQVHVSKRLRKKISKVIAGKKVQGHVRQIYTGAMGQISLIPNPLTFINMGGLSSQVGEFGGSNSVFVWQSMVNFDTASVVPVFDAGTDFRLFSPQRILDCASILWNDKGIALNYNLSANNLTDVVDNNGVPTPANQYGVFDNTTQTYTTAPGIASGGPQITVKKARATFLIKNNSQRTMYLQMYVCKAKRRGVSTSPLESWKNTVSVETRQANNFNDSLLTFGPTPIGSGVDPVKPYLLMGATPNISPNFANDWKYELVEMCLEPGQIITQVVHGPRNVDYDFSKMFLGSVNSYNCAWPAFDRWIMFVGHLDLVCDTDGRVGHQSVANRFLCVEMTLDTILAMPEVTGFESNVGAGVNNNAQPLNARRPRKALLNFTNYKDAAYINVARVDDQNPVTTTT